MLRKFRDKILFNDFYGIQVVTAYYIIGPKLASWINDKQQIKKFIRIGLRPVVCFAGLLTGGI